MAGENGERQDINISNGKGQSGGGGEAEKTSTQTREGEAGGEGGNTTTHEGGEEGAGTGGGEGAGGSGDGDVLTPDKDGKVIHPETKEKVDPVVVAAYYRDQFAASTRGAQDLLTKISTADETHKGEIVALTTKVEELTKLAEGKNPEGLTALQIKEQLDKTTKELVVLKETQTLDAFEKVTPLATGALRESLKALMRANPTVAPQKLWDDNLKAGADAAKAAADAKKKAQKDGAGERGKGTSTRESAGGGATVRGNKGDTGLTLEEFNKLPVAERGILLNKFDIRM